LWYGSDCIAVRIPRPVHTSIALSSPALLISNTIVYLRRDSKNMILKSITVMLIPIVVIWFWGVVLKVLPKIMTV
jgi:hypothetical protein